MSGSCWLSGEVRRLLMLDLRNQEHRHDEYGNPRAGDEDSLKPGVDRGNQRKDQNESRRDDRAKEGHAQAHDRYRADRDDHEHQDRRGEDRRDERDELLRKIHERVSAREGADYQQEHPAVEISDGERVSEETEHQPEDDDAGRPEPREFAEAIDGSNAQHVEGNRPSEQEALVFPNVCSLAVAANELRRLQG